MLRIASPLAFLPKTETSDRSREFPDTSCSSVTSCVLPYWRSVSSSRWRRVSVVSSWITLFFQKFFLMLAAPEVGHLHHQKQRYDRAAQGVYHLLLLHARLVYELDILVFTVTWHKLHVSLGNQIAHATWSLAGTQDSSGPTQYIPL